LYKKSSPEIGYVSLEKAYTREAIEEAWLWLQMERHLIDKADEERSDATARRIAEDYQIRKIIVALFSAGAQLYLLPFALGAILVLITNTLWIGDASFLIAVAIQSYRLAKKSKQ